jgi:hypothetical protein
MKRKNFFTGSVFQFYIPEIKKFCFCKFFDFTHLSSFHGLLAQVFNKFSESEKNGLEDLRDCSYLFGPRSMHKWPNLQKDSGWKSLGILSDGRDQIVPDFKGTNFRVVEDDREINQWYAIRNLIENIDCDYEQVSHLERIVLTTSKFGLSWRTGMEYCRINGLPVNKFYNLEDGGMKSIYKQMINVPIYSTIPQNIRGKALIG